MGRLFLSITIVVLFLMLLFIICQQAGWANDLSCAEGCVYFTEEPNEPIPEPEVYGFNYILMNVAEEPNEPEEPEPESI
jgi:hypothetical protein